MVRGVEDLDRQIVRLLAADGRRSYTDLARDTGLSVSALHQRVRRLEKRGVIRGYRADVDCDEVGLPLTAFVSIKPCPARWRKIEQVRRANELIHDYCEIHPYLEYIDVFTPMREDFV